MKNNLSYSCFNSPLGKLHIYASGKGICYIAISSNADKLKITSEREVKSPLLKKCSKELKGYFEGKRKIFTTPVDFLNGTEFQKKVWKELGKIPYGQTWTYKIIADKIGNPKACRAVGNAVGNNPVSIIIPCHRVIKSNGGIGGFSSGLRHKIKLLKLEGVIKEQKECSKIKFIS